MLAALSLAALCLLAVALLLKLLLVSGLAARIAVDRPNERSLHAAPVPRIGGLVLLGVALAVVAAAAPSLRALAAIAAVLMLVSAWDDRQGLPVPLRFGVHLLAAAAALYVLPLAAAPWVLLLTGLALAWAMNLYNFMDGADGLAGGMAVIGFGALGVAAWGEAPDLATACLCLAGAAAGFLWHNFHPARVFLGDAGSIPLGFLAGSLGLAGWLQALWPPWFPLLVFSPFVVDATLTLALRLRRGEKPWQAHRQHVYQRMVAGGLGHRRTALAWYALMAAAAASALAALRLSPGLQWAVLLCWLAIYGILAVALGRRFPVKSKPDQR